jgi:limonene-1,2-epoxide hydrolase
MTSTTTTEPEQLVRDFLAAMGPTLQDFKRNYRDRMTADVVWETVGLPAHHGIEACVVYLDDLHARTGMEYCTIEILHLATAGGVVLSERRDRMHRADGAVITTFRVMGAIELREGKITRCTDYLDTWHARTGLSSPSPDLSSAE